MIEDPGTNDLFLDRGDIGLIQDAWANRKTHLSKLTSLERKAFVQTNSTLEKLGRRVVAEFGTQDTLSFQTSPGFDLAKAHDGGVPRMLSLVIFPQEQGQRRSPFPELFLALSNRGLEYGFGAVADTDDPKTRIIQRWIKRVAPEVFDILKRQRAGRSMEAGSANDGSADWTFKRNDNPLVEHLQFSDVNDWLRFLKSQKERLNRSIAITKVFPNPKAELAHFSEAFIAAARLFQPLLEPCGQEAKKRSPAGDDTAKEHSKVEAADAKMRDHAAVLIEFLTALYPRRFGAFRIDAPLAALIKEITDRIAGDPAVSSRSGVTVSVDVGQADWVGTPWIGIHDSRMNSSPQSAIFAGLLISEDFSTVSFMLYHGIKYSVMKYGGRASVAAMQRTYNSVHTKLLPMAAQGFELSRERYFLSETASETLYENATVAQFSVSTDALPPDESWSDLLTTLLDGYQRLVERTLPSE